MQVGKSWKTVLFYIFSYVLLGAELVFIIKNGNFQAFFYREKELYQWLLRIMLVTYEQSLHKKWSFPLRISSINVTESAVSCEFSHIYWRNSEQKTSIFLSCESSFQLLNNHASNWCRIMSVTVKESYQRSLKNRVDSCWFIVPVTVEQLCQRLLNNCATYCRRIFRVTVDQSSQQLLNKRATQQTYRQKLVLEFGCGLI